MVESSPDSARGSICKDQGAEEGGHVVLGHERFLALILLIVFLLNLFYVLVAGGTPLQL